MLRISVGRSKKPSRRGGWVSDDAFRCPAAVGSVVAVMMMPVCLLWGQQEEEIAQDDFVDSLRDVG